MYLQINIGRNVNLTEPQSPMTQQAWEDFQEECRGIIESFALHYNAGFDSDDIQTHVGIGQWHGTPEESAHISVFWEFGFDLDGIRAQLNDLKQRYAQDNIALITSSELI